MTGATDIATPYKGLIPYSEEDNPFFFGREREQQIITANLRATRLTLLYGTSGVGKSSVLRAGVAYHLRQFAKQNMQTRGTPRHAVVVFPDIETSGGRSTRRDGKCGTWRDDPLNSLLNQVYASVAELFEPKKIEPIKSRSFSDALEDYTKILGETKSAKSKDHAVPGDLYIILDQFEDYFLYHPQEDGDGTFAVEFPRAVNRSDLRVNYLIAIREDALARLDRFKGRIPNLFANRLRIEHLDRDGARKAIEDPVKQFNTLRQPDKTPITFEEPLADTVIGQVADLIDPTGIFLGGGGGGRAVNGSAGDARVQTPYLQLVMTALWDEEMRQNSHVLRVTTLNERLGGADHIVRTHLNKVMETLTDTERMISARIFYQLITPSGEKFAQKVSDLASFAELSMDKLLPVLKRLSDPDVRVLRPVASSLYRAEDQRYEVFHDVLAKAILNWRSEYKQKQDRDEAIRRAQEEAAQREKEAVHQKELEMERQRAEFERLRAEEYQRRSEAEREKAQAESLRAESERQRAEEFQRRAQAESEKAEAERLQAQERQRRVDTERRRDRWRYLSRLLAAMLLLALILGGITVYALFQAKAKSLEARQSLYFSSITSAQRMWEDGNVGLVIQNLGIDNCPYDLRDWEWRYLNRLCHSSLYTLQAHTGSVYCVAFSPNGRLLASGSEDKTVIVWDWREDKVLYTFRHEGPVYSVAFNPKHPEQLASAGGDKTVQIWNVENGQHLRTLLGHTAAVRSIAFTNKSGQLATAGDDRLIRIWNPQTGDKVTEKLNAGEEPILSIAFSPDGIHLAAGSGIPNLSGTPNPDAFPPRNEWTGEIKIWNTQTWQERRIRGNHGPYYCVAFSNPDGKELASGSFEGVVTFWNVETGKESQQPVNHGDSVFAVAYSPVSDDHRLMSAGRTQTIQVWDSQKAREEKDSGRQDLPLIRGDSGLILGAAFSPDARYIASASSDKTVRVWYSKCRPDYRDFDFKQSATLSLCVAISPDSSLLASGGMGQAVTVWDLNQSMEKDSNKVSDALSVEGSVFSVAFDSSGKFLALAGESNEHGIVTLWEVKEKNKENKWEKRHLFPHDRPVYAVTFNPKDSRQLVTASGELVRMWDVNTQKELHTLKGHNGTVRSVAFSHDGRLLASASDDHTVCLWEAATGKRLLTFDRHSREVYGVTFSPDGSRIASAGADSFVRIWESATGNEILAMKHKDAVLSVAFSPNGKRLATGSEDMYVRLWDAATGLELLYYGQNNNIYGLVFSPDGRYLASASGYPAPVQDDNTKLKVQGRIRVWEAPPDG